MNTERKIAKLKDRLERIKDEGLKRSQKRLEMRPGNST